MPCMGPGYSEEKADKVAEELWDKLLIENKLLQIPIQNVHLIDPIALRKNAKDHFFKSVHSVFELDCFEGF